MNLLEQKVRTDFRARWIGWLETYQPGLGGGSGVPDVQIMPRPNFLVPIELKRGWIEGGRLFVDKIRPDQVSWHTRFALEGGRSWFYIGALHPEQGHMIRFMIEANLALATRTDGILTTVRACYHIPTGYKVAKSDPLFTQAITEAVR